MRGIRKRAMQTKPCALAGRIWDFAKLLLGVRLEYVIRGNIRGRLTGYCSHFLRSNMQEVSKRQRAGDQLPALLEIECVEAAGSRPAHRLDGRAQRHVNYESPCLTHHIFGIKTTLFTLNGHKTKAHAWNRHQRIHVFIVKCLRREGRSTSNWRAGRDASAGQGGGSPACLSPCMLQCTRLASANRGETTGDLASFRVLSSTPKQLMILSYVADDWDGNWIHQRIFVLIYLLSEDIILTGPLL